MLHLIWCAPVAICEWLQVAVLCFFGRGVSRRFWDGSFDSCVMRLRVLTASPTHVRADMHRSFATPNCIAHPIPASTGGSKFLIIASTMLEATHLPPLEKGVSVERDLIHLTVEGATPSLLNPN